MTEVAVKERSELKTSKGGCLTPTVLIVIICSWMAWKVAHGETDDIHFGWVGCGIHLAPGVQSP
jgi:hypothetical protein